MTVTRFVDHILGPDTHANRPAATGAGACPWGTVYHCTTHNMLEMNELGTWIDWASLAGTSAAVLTTKGDILTRDASGLVRLPVGANGTVLTADSSVADGVKWAAAAGGGGTLETYDTAVAALTGVVHRWKFDDASGATVADSVGSLNLTLSGTYTRATSAPNGAASGTTITATGGAISSGAGSIPTGANDRCIVMLYRTTSAAAQALIDFGAGATRQNFAASVVANSSSGPGNLQLVAWGDDTLVGYPPITGPEITGSFGEWNLLAIGYRNAALTTFLYHNGALIPKILGGALNTASSNFKVGGTLLGGVDDVLVMNNWPGKLALDRLLAAAAGVAWIPH